MTFKTEFKLSEYQLKVESRKNVIIESYAARHKADIGNAIGDVFGWENPVNENQFHYKLEIEAFPMDKWVEFKRQFFVHLGATGIYEPGFKALFEELESFGNPVTSK